MKRWIYIVLVFLIIFSFNSNVFASSGGLKKASIKTCPNGVTYGYHGDDNHWHVAKPNGNWSGWTAEGDPLPGDPCPGSNSNTTTVPTTTHTTRSAQNSVAPAVANKQVTNSNNNETAKQQVDETTTTTEPVTETTTTSSTSKNKLEPKLETLYVNNSKVTFDSANKGSTTEFYGTNMISIGYFLNSNDFDFKVYDKDDNEITNIDEINLNFGNNKYKIVVSNKEGNSINYYLTVERYNLMQTIFAMLICAVIVFLLPVLFIRFILRKIKKKR